MIGFREAASGIYGAWRLAHLDRGGHRWFDATRTGALRSFWAAAIAAPAYLLLVLSRGDGDLDPARPLPEIDFGRELLVQSLAYAIMWAAFPLVAEKLVRLVDRAGRFLSLVCAYNWAQVISLGAQAAAQIVVLAGILPPPLANLLRLVVLLAVIGYHGFVVKTALDVGWGAAAGFVLADLAIVILVTNLAQAIEPG
jgi:hypothetical protein